MAYVENLKQREERLNTALEEEEDTVVEVFILVERKKIDRTPIPGDGGLTGGGRSSRQRYETSWPGKRTFRFCIDMTVDEIKQLVNK